MAKPNQSDNSNGHGGGRDGSGPKSKAITKVKEILKINSKTEEWLVGYLTKAFLESDYIYKRSSIPVAASFAASSTSLFDDDYMFSLDIRDIFGDNKKSNFFPVYGDSMIDAGIYPGDDVCVERIEPGTPVNHGTRVLVRLQDYLTVKTYRERNGRIYLAAENAKLNLPEQPLGEGDQILGVVLTSFRKIGRCR